MKKRILKICFLVCFGLAVLPMSSLYAATGGTTVPSLGGASLNLASAFGTFTDIFYNICYTIGGAMWVGCVIQYKNYRDNPSQVRLSTPIMLLIIGCVLIALPFIGQLSSASTAGTVAAEQVS